MRSIRGLSALAAAIAVAALAPTVPAAAAAATTAPMQWKATSGGKGLTEDGWATAVSPDGSTVFSAGYANYSKDMDLGFGKLVAYNAATGAVDWSARYWVKGDDTGFTSVAVSPNGSTVIVNGYTGVLEPSGEENELTVAYNAATGAKLWQVIGPSTGGGLDGVPLSSSAVGPVVGEIVVSADSSTVYVSTGDIEPNGETAAYNASTGALLWSEPTGGLGIALASNGATVYVPSRNSSTGNAELLALNAATGATIWQTGTGSAFFAVALSPDGSTLFASGDKTTAAYSAASGTQLWSVTTPAHYQVGLAATGSAVIVADTDGGNQHPFRPYHLRMLALNPATGATIWTREEWQKPSLGFLASGLALSPNGTTAYVAGYADTGSGNIRFFAVGYDTATGTLVWGAHYAAQRNAFAYAMAISPSGSQVFLTGGANRNSGSDLTDVMATVAFGTS